MTKRGGIFLLACMLTFGTAAQAQINAYSQTKRISLKLTSESAKVCLGSFVPLELKITNHSDREIQISKLDVWRDFSFEYVDPDGSKKDIGYGIVPGRIEDYVRLRDDVITMKADSAYTTTYRFPLVDRRFFESPRKYTLTSYLYYNGHNDVAGSNAVSFEIYDCNSK